MIAALGIFLLALAVPAAADGGSLRRTVEFMAGLGSRLSGYPGAEKAADYVERRLRALGFAEVEREAFSLAVPIDRGGELLLPGSGEKWPLYGLWPNAARTPTLPPQGLRAQLVYGGRGRYEDLAGLEMDGRVVLLDFNSWNNWLRAASLGARAIVFIEPEETSRAQASAKYANVPLDIPRFWIGRAAGRRLQALAAAAGEVQVHLRGRMDWEEKTGWNIWARLPGTDPRRADETIVVEAYYDGISIVPALAPAAEMASSIAALLELARHLAENPPIRPVVLAATGAHFQGQRGIADFLDRHARTHPFYAARMQRPLAPRLFISLDLSTQTDQLGLWNNTNSYDLKRFFVPFGRRFSRYNEELAPRLGREAARSLVNGISPIRGMDWDTFVPGGIAVNSVQALAAGLVSLALVTVNDGRFQVDTPHDDLAQVDFANLERQSQLLNLLLSRAFGDPDLFDGLEDFGPVLEDELRSLRVKVRAFPRRSQVPDRPLPHALVALHTGAKPHKGVHRTQYHLTDEEGNVEIGALHTGWTSIAAYVLEPESGRILYAPDLGGRAQKFHGRPAAGWILSSQVRWQTNEKTIVVFPCIAAAFYGLIDPRYLGALGDIRVVDRTGVAPRQFGLARGWDDGEPVGVLFAPLDAEEDSGLKLVVTGRMLLLNSEGSRSEEEARGRGYDLRRESLVHTGMLALRDMWNLNEARLRTMREHAIENQRLTRLHERARQWVRRAQRAEAERDWPTYVASIRAGLGLVARAYPEVLATLNDVIKGIVFFLALVIPSAFLGERLLFAAADIRRQLLGFAGLLALVWLAIAQVHPAFAIAHPLVVLLAFAIMAMAALVLFMVGSRFNRFMKEYQARAAHVHETDISRTSASYAAFMLGISNMRRRKLRTGLTLLTLVLLTFTVLSFTSFNAQVRYMAFTMAHAGPYEGVLIRDRNWSALTLPTLDYARSHFAAEGVVVPRNWYMASEDEEKKFIEVERRGQVVRATGLLGLAPRETQVTAISSALRAGAFFRPGDGDVCLLSEEMARTLGIGAAEVGRASVRIFGRWFAVRGLFSAAAFARVRDLDGEMLTPADFQMSSTQALGPNQVDEMSMAVEEEALDVKPFVHLEPENVVVLPYEVLRAAGGSLRSVAVRFAEGAPAQALIEDFLLRLAITLFAGLRDAEEGAIKVFSYTSVGMTNVEGLGALVVPMFIAALIVLNAMMGAVYERFREIGIYSSVGLAPRHIALLFVAEAVVYAVIGVTLGYMLGQGLGKALIHFGWLRGMNLNYSSFAAILSALLVMAVVLLSTLYPARVAAQAAVPDTVRRWRPPAPQGDRWEFEFPFMVSETEVVGLCGFLANFFEAYSEESIGDFYAEKVRVVREEGPAGGEYAVQLLLWLAPFDMGVSQFVQLEFLPTAVRGVHAVEIFIQRISGQDTFWQRVNQRFVNSLRKEFLLWHTLDESDKAHHRQRAQSLLAAAAVEVEGS